MENQMGWMQGVDVDKVQVSCSELRWETGIKKALVEKNVINLLAKDQHTRLTEDGLEVGLMDGLEVGFSLGAEVGDWNKKSIS